MDETKRVKVTADCLVVGDLLLGSKETVARGPQKGFTTPTGKVEVILTSSKGTNRTAIWGARTTIWVLRQTK